MTCILRMVKLVVCDWAQRVSFHLPWSRAFQSGYNGSSYGLRTQIRQSMWLLWVPAYWGAGRGYRQEVRGWGGGGKTDGRRTEADRWRGGGHVARDIAQWHKNGHQSPVQHNLCGIHHFFYCHLCPSPNFPPLLFPVHFSDNLIN